jgi:hypothetical protein
MGVFSVAGNGVVVSGLGPVPPDDPEVERAKQTHSIPDFPICKRGGFFPLKFKTLFRRDAPDGGRVRPSGIFREI